MFWVGLMGGLLILVFGDRTGDGHEMALESVSRDKFGRFRERFSSRGRWPRSRAQLWPKTDPKPKLKSRF